MLNIVIAILILMCISGLGIMIISIGCIIYFLIWATIECFKENIFCGIFTLFASIGIIGYIALIIISNIVEVIK